MEVYTIGDLRIGVFDFEANGLLDTVTNIWCMWVMCPFTGRGRGYRPDEIPQALEFLETLDIVVGHNVTGFDVLLAEKFYPNFKCPKVFDTLVLSRMLDPARQQHGLKSYGIELGTLKGTYGEEEEAWDKFTEEMFSYCKTKCSDSNY